MATLRRAEPRDAGAAARLILEAAPSLEVIFGRDDGIRAVETAYLGDRTELSYRFGMVAEEGSGVVGLVIAFPGRQLSGLKLGTGVVLARAGGGRHVGDLVKRGRTLDRLQPKVGVGDLYVSVLSVSAAHRGKGIGRQLLERVIAGAESMGLGVVVDSVAASEGGGGLYERLGFELVSVREATAAERRLLPVSGSVRLRRPGPPT